MINALLMSHWYIHYKAGAPTAKTRQHISPSSGVPRQMTQANLNVPRAIDPEASALIHSTGMLGHQLI